MVKTNTVRLIDNLLFEMKTSSNPNPQTIIRQAKKQFKKSKTV